MNWSKVSTGKGGAGLDGPQSPVEGNLGSLSQDEQDDGEQEDGPSSERVAGPAVNISVCSHRAKTYM